MKITVLNGSPKGPQSVTMQYVHLIQKKFPQHELKIFHVAQRIRKLEKNEAALQETLDDVQAADGVLWAFPLYTLLVHSDYKRFIELIRERGGQDVFQGKYAAALSTSIHFYDDTAHEYIHAICDDLNMRYLDFYSAAMRDLLDKEQQAQILRFAEHLFDDIAQAAPTVKQYQPVTPTTFEYVPIAASASVNIGKQRVLIITDAEDEHCNEAKMVARLQQTFAPNVEVVNLNTLDMKGGCLGCIRCGYDNTCAWEGKDDFIEMYKTKVQPADVLIFAGTIKDRYLSARWKAFLDRRFFNTHSPTLLHKQFGFLISGPLRQIPNLRRMLEAFIEFQHSHLVGIVTDEGADSAAIDRQIEHLAGQLIRCAEEGYRKPQTFLGVGAMKVFRDEIWGPLRFVFRADHKYYKAHGFYDFPQSAYKTRLLNALGAIAMKIAPFRKRFYIKEIKPGMIRFLQKSVERA